MARRRNRHSNPRVAILLAVAVCGPVWAGPSAEEKYQARAAKLDADDTKGRYRLGLWCRRHHLPLRARECFERVLRLDPDHEGARRHLGYVRYRDRSVAESDLAAAEFEDRRAEIVADDAKALFALAECFGWMKAFTRDPNPKHLVWEPFTSKRYPTYKNHFCWLHLAEPRNGMRIEAHIADNRITLTTDGGVRGLSLLLNHKLVDPSRPVIVKENGKLAFKGKLGASLTALVTSYVAKEDPAMIYPYRIELR